jgi:hypothetical protein
MKPQWYYDSFNGLLPCKVLSITGEPGPASTAQRVKLQITSRKRRGEIIETSGLHLVPWQAIRRSKYGTYIRPYSLEIPDTQG